MITLELPEPLLIVQDEAVRRWELRTDPWIHIAISLKLAEELRAVRKPISSYDLGRLLGIPLLERGGDWNGFPYLASYATLSRLRGITA